MTLEPTHGGLERVFRDNGDRSSSSPGRAPAPAHIILLLMTDPVTLLVDRAAGRPPRAPARETIA